MKFIICECGKRIRDDNKKHYDSNEHKKIMNNLKKKKTSKQETHIIVYDIDKNKLMEFIKNNCNNIIDESNDENSNSNSDSDYNPSDSEGDNEESY
jgi:hypothetical protein